MATFSLQGFAPLDAESQLAFAITSSTAFALVLWEFIILLPQEIQLYRKAVWATVPPYAFIFLRYSSILATLPNVFLGAVSNISCQTAASLSQAGMILVVVSTAIIFTFRTAQLWAHNGKRNTLLMSLGGLILVVIGCCVAPAIQYRVASVSSTRSTFSPSSCRVLPTPPYLPLAPGAALAFLLAVLILSLLQIKAHDPREVSQMTYRLYRAHVLYVFGATVACAATLIILCMAPPASGLAMCVQPLFVFFTSAFGTRDFRNYMLARVLGGDSSGRGSPVLYPSSSPIISPANEARYGYTYADTQKPPPSSFTPAPNRTQQPPGRPKKDAIQARHQPSGSTAPLINVAGNTKLSPNPYTSFPSPPASYDGHSSLSVASAALNHPANRSAISVNASTPSSSPHSPHTAAAGNGATSHARCCEIRLVGLVVLFTDLLWTKYVRHNFYRTFL
ncbi:hypothetical protein MIND_00626000 [Mycena indigotica]|uniref:DUF6533 domain-containing protein n=1 Tax=Mycena indigotica TaxID=2126181 RepID=A0A8H6SRN0_9AGAR|nr:uncharacterized protein MIND_00626000 [Mycena indigotica]KAF7303953.1 hypothetical protein MIND_00626000 [Mycena indigotica]